MKRWEIHKGPWSVLLRRVAGSETPLEEFASVTDLVEFSRRFPERCLQAYTKLAGNDDYPGGDKRVSDCFMLELQVFWENWLVSCEDDS